MSRLRYHPLLLEKRRKLSKSEEKVKYSIFDSRVFILLRFRVCFSVFCVFPTVFRSVRFFLFFTSTRVLFCVDFSLRNSTKLIGSIFLEISYNVWHEFLELYGNFAYSWRKSCACVWLIRNLLVSPCPCSFSISLYHWLTLSRFCLRLSRRLLRICCPFGFFIFWQI